MGVKTSSFAVSVLNLIKMGDSFDGSSMRFGEKETDSMVRCHKSGTFRGFLTHGEECLLLTYARRFVNEQQAKGEGKDRTEKTTIFHHANPFKRGVIHLEI